MASSSTSALASSQGVPLRGSFANDKWPLASSQGFTVASMNLGGAALNFNQSKREKPRYENRLVMEMQAMMGTAHALVVRELNVHWYEWVSPILAREGWGVNARWR